MTSSAQLQRSAPLKNGAALDLKKMSRGELEQMVQVGAQLVAMMRERLEMPLVLLDDKVTSQTRFVEIGGVLLRAVVTCQSGLTVYDPLNLELVCCEPPNVTWDIQPCREGDLLNAMEAVTDGNAKVQFRKWIEKLRQADEPKAPLEIKIVNAKEVFQPAKILTVKRTDGQISGATIEPVG